MKDALAAHVNALSLFEKLDELECMQAWAALLRSLPTELLLKRHEHR